jgi:hypothetical protein
MTTSSFSSDALLKTFHEQQEASEALFKNLRANLVLQLSEALKPLIAFLEQHDGDEEDILQAIFEAIAYEKDAEAELGVFAYDSHQDLDAADRFAGMLYKFGLELFKEFQTHQLYRHGFLPYQYTRRHGRDLIVSRLSVPEIMHRDQELRDVSFNPPVFGDLSYKPMATLAVRRASQPPCEFLNEADAIKKFEQEMEAMFKGLKQNDAHAATPPRDSTSE